MLKQTLSLIKRGLLLMNDKISVVTLLQLAEGCLLACCLHLLLSFPLYFGFQKNSIDDENCDNSVLFFRIVNNCAAHYRASPVKE